MAPLSAQIEFARETTPRTAVIPKRERIMVLLWLSLDDTSPAEMDPANTPNDPTKKIDPASPGVRLMSSLMEGRSGEKMSRLRNVRKKRSVR
jgi:hypothetical protein